MISLFARRISFWLALAGLTLTTLLVVRMRAELRADPPEPSSPPATNPYGTGLGAAGLVEAWAENTAVAPPQSGVVAAVLVKVWDRVEAGQPLLVLDRRELEATLPVQQANVEVAAAQLARLRGQLERLEGVADPRAVTQEEVRSRRAEVRVAEAQWHSALAAEAHTRALLERLVVCAPISGTVLQVNVRPGEYITPSSTVPALVLGNTDTLQIRAEVDEQLARRIVPGAVATGFIKGDPADPIPLKFERIEPLVVPKRSLTGSSAERVDTRVLQVIYSFAPAGRPIFVGQQMDVFIAAEGAR